MNDLDKALEWAEQWEGTDTNGAKRILTLAAAVRELRETVKARDEEIARLMQLVIKTKRFERGDCPICHYNGPEYFQPDKHPCAKYYHDPGNPSLDAALNSGDGSYKP